MSLKSPGNKKVETDLDSTAVWNELEQVGQNEESFGVFDRFPDGLEETKKKKKKQTSCSFCSCCYTAGRSFGSLLDHDVNVDVNVNTGDNPIGNGFETGTLRRPDRKFEQLTLAELRIYSNDSLNNPRFTAHTQMDMYGNLLFDPAYMTKSRNRKTKTQSDKVSEFSTLNNMVQIRIENETQCNVAPKIKVPPKNIFLTRKSQQQQNEKKNSILPKIVKNPFAKVKPTSSGTETDPPLPGKTKATKNWSTALTVHSFKGNNTTTSTPTDLTQNMILSKMQNLKSPRKSGYVVSDKDVHDMLPLPTSKFLEVLPGVNKIAAQEVIGDPKQNLKKCKYLEMCFKKMKPTKAQFRPYPSERWLAVIYCDRATTKEDQQFRRLVIKLLFYTHLIGFVEKDVRQEEGKKELDERQKFRLSNFQLPIVFTKGLAIGGCSTIFFMHIQGTIQTFFKHCIMDPDLYCQWLYKSDGTNPRVLPSIKVPLSHFPLVHGVMSERLVSKNDTDWFDTMETFVMEGAYIVNMAQKSWNAVLKRCVLTEPDLLKFVLLRITTIRVLLVIENRLQQCNLMEVYDDSVGYAGSLNKAKCKVM